MFLIIFLYIGIELSGVNYRLSRAIESVFIGIFSSFFVIFIAYSVEYRAEREERLRKINSMLMTLSTIITKIYLPPLNVPYAIFMNYLRYVELRDEYVRGSKTADNTKVVKEYLECRSKHIKNIDSLEGKYSFKGNNVDVLNFFHIPDISEIERHYFQLTNFNSHELKGLIDDLCFFADRFKPGNKKLRVKLINNYSRVESFVRSAKDYRFKIESYDFNKGHKVSNIAYRYNALHVLENYKSISKITELNDEVAKAERIDVASCDLSFITVKIGHFLNSKPLPLKNEETGMPFDYYYLHESDLKKLDKSYGEENLSHPTTKRRNNMNLAMYILVNQDIKISKGKLAGQVGHSVATYFYRGKYTKELMDEYMKQQKKIILSCSQGKLEELEREGYIAIRDLGLTQLEKGTFTCVNIGIIDRDEGVPDFVKELKLYQ